MLKSKAILVQGDTVYKYGKQVRNLGVKVEEAIDKALAAIDPESVVDIKINTEFTGISGDNAFVLILYKADKTKK